MQLQSNHNAGHDLFIKNALIYTCDDNDSVADSLLIRDGKIQYVGRETELCDNAGGASVLDARGGVILPGLIDTHPHLLHYGSLEEPLVDLLDARSHAEIVHRLAKRAIDTPEAEWIMATPVGEPYFFIRSNYKSQLLEGEMPTREVLDRASDKHPIVIQSWAPTLPSVIAFNSVALDKLGLDSSLPDRVGNVWIEKDANGELTGRLTGSVTNYYNNDEFANSLWLKIPFLEYKNLVPGLKSAINRYHKMGITSVYENHMMDKVLIDAYRELDATNELGLRAMCAQEAEAYGMPWSKPRDMPDFVRRLEQAGDSISLQGDNFRFNGITIMWDGNCNPGGNMMKEHYCNPYGEETKGYYHITPEKAEYVMRFCAERRIRLNTMCMGTQASEENLELLEKIDREYDIKPLKWIIVHAIFIEPEQVRRYKALNMDFSTSMAFCWGKGDMIRKRYPNNQEMLNDFMPVKRFFREGFNVAGASDWGPKSAFEQMQIAITHEFAGSGYRNNGPDQSVSREEAIRMWTKDASRVMQWDGIGQIKPGAHGDLVFTDRDPFKCSLEDLAGTKVLRTIFNGKVVHESF